MRRLYLTALVVVLVSGHGADLRADAQLAGDAGSTADTMPVRAEWLRASYHNGLKHGAIGGGLAIAARERSPDAEYALVVEVLALRPVKLNTSATLRILSAGGTLVLELAPARLSWPVPSSAGAKIKGTIAYSMRQAYPITREQLATLRQTDKPIVEIVHGEGTAGLKLRNGELEAIDEFLFSAPP